MCMLCMLCSAPCCRSGGWAHLYVCKAGGTPTHLSTYAAGRSRRPPFTLQTGKTTLYFPVALKKLYGNLMDWPASLLILLTLGVVCMTA